MRAGPVSVILDVDTGVDDALALLLAVRHPLVKLRLVTCVAGNASLARVASNTRAVLAAAGASDVPVALGAERPLIAPHRDSALFHGADGLGGVALPRPPEDGNLPKAIDALRRAIEESPDMLTLVALGPLTNVALLVRADPAIVSRLERIVFMGGAMSVGNATPVAEFNVWSDPEAAAIVLTAACPVTLYGLDVFYDVAVGTPDIETLSSASGNPSAQLAGRLLAHLHRMDLIENRVAMPTNTCIGDAGVLCAVINPAGLTTRQLPVGIVLDGQAARGQTVVDRRSRAGEGDHPDFLPMRTIDVAVRADAEAFRRIFLDGVLGKAE